MSCLLSRSVLAFGTHFIAITPIAAAPVINEIMYHPGHAALTPEPINEEWIELRNPDPFPADISGWRFTRGIDYTIPAATSIPAGGFLVIASNVAAFQAAHPGFSGTVIGGWTGQLSSGGETIELEDAAGATVDEIQYADDGDWATRVRGPLSFGHRGWEWESPADGGGHSVELIGPSIDSGLAWTASVTPGGTPGAANSNSAAPLFVVRDVRHRPEIPRSTDTISIKADFYGTAFTNQVLRWRRDGQASFQTTGFQMEAGETFSGDFWRGVATIPPQPNGTVIEFYLSDGTRTWPAPARTSAPGVSPETFAQVTNALVQVDNSFDPTRPSRARRAADLPADHDGGRTRGAGAYRHDERAGGFRGADERHVHLARRHRREDALSLRLSQSRLRFGARAAEQFPRRFRDVRPLERPLEHPAQLPVRLLAGARRALVSARRPRHAGGGDRAVAGQWRRSRRDRPAHVRPLRARGRPRRRMG